MRRGPATKPRSKLDASASGAPAGAQQRRDARLAVAGAQALQPLRHQDAVVGVERHHVGDGAQRDQVGERSEVRFLLSSKAPLLRSSARSASIT